MNFYADLHIHSKWSRACSQDCDLEHLALWRSRRASALSVRPFAKTFPRLVTFGGTAAAGGVSRVTVVGRDVGACQLCHQSGHPATSCWSPRAS
jgi:hypothetical protein